MNPPASLWRRLRDSGGAGLNPALAWMVAVWAAHAVLRVLILFRNDAYGFPFVGKPDWYIFHALSIDWLWILKWSAPFAAVAWIASAHGRRLPARLAIWALMSFHAVLLVMTVVDHETQRFLGMHLEPTLISTYGNPAAGRDLYKFIAGDESIPYLQWFTIPGCVPLALALFAWLRGRAWVKSARVGKAPLVMLGAAAVAYVFLNYLWTGGFRMLKLKPYVAILSDALLTRSGKPSAPVDLAETGAVFQRQWLLEQGDSGWVFPDTAYPLYKMPVEHWCAQRSGKPGAPARCAVDADGDGHLPGPDCDDGNARAFPGGREIPTDGVDQDCDGMDASPPNFVLFLLESHRAVNAGHLRPFGALAGQPDSVDPTPVMDSIVKAGGHAWTRFSCSALPTINAVLTMHMSILQHPDRYIAGSFTGLRNRVFTQELSDRGYHTRYFSAGDPAWDGKTPWLRQWYQGIYYDRSLETDGPFLRNLSGWMHDSLKDGRPFFITALTKTNHYPFNPEPPMPPSAPGASLQDRMLASMKYADASVGEFIESLRDQPWFGNTIFILMADHGFPLTEHGSSTIGYGLYSESIWIPFVMAGTHPEVGPGALHDYPASQFDIGPTVLDLAGIRVPDHSLGHSLARPATGLHSLTYIIRQEQGALDYGDYRIHGPLGDMPRQQGNQVFDMRGDRLEKKDLYGQPGPGRAVYDSLMPFLRTMGRLNTHLIETNRLWPEPVPAGAAAAGSPR